MKEINFDTRKAPTQEQFNEYHKEPLDYGEDGDQLLGKQYTKEQAIEIFKKDWKDKTGEEPDFDVAASVIEGSAGWTENPDLYDGGEFCFVMLSVSTKETRVRYEAWKLWV